MIQHVIYYTADGKKHEMDILSWSFNEYEVCFTDLDGIEHYFQRWKYYDVDPESLGYIHLGSLISNFSIMEVAYGTV